MIEQLTNKLRTSIGTAIVGKAEVIDHVIAALLCGGHVLLEDIPGTGKTTLARALARSIGGTQTRIQFTPDLLPSDITGSYYYNQKTQEFLFRKGGVFTDVLLADEINRATPRTQSALLECMEERQVSVDGESFPLSDTFFVIATQNPVETQGTYPLPEAQLDRFQMCLQLGYPDRAAEKRILAGESHAVTESVCTTEELLQARAALAKVRVLDPMAEYLLSIAEATRIDSRIALGLSPRGLLALQQSARAFAAMQGRDYIIPEDVRKAAPSVMAHRLVTKGSAFLRNTEKTAALVRELVDAVPVPKDVC